MRSLRGGSLHRALHERRCDTGSLLDGYSSGAPSVPTHKHEIVALIFGKSDLYKYSCFYL